MRYKAQDDHGTRSRGQLETAMPGSSSWMPYVPQGVKGSDDDDDDDDEQFNVCNSARISVQGGT